MTKEIDHLSCSQITLYSQCSLKYKFHYIDEIPALFKPAALALGSSIHEAISWFHMEKMNGNGVTLEKLYSIFDADFYAQTVGNEIKYSTKETEIDLNIKGREMLELYFENPTPDVIGTEVQFTLPLNHPSNGEKLGINFEGVIDQIAKNDTIVEIKTSAQTMQYEDAQKMLQLTAYSYAYEKLYQKPPKNLYVYNLVKLKKPKVNILSTERDTDDYIRFFHIAKKVFEGIKSQIFFPQPSFWCNGCEFTTQCLTWQGN
ncbi:PD-(D/E)XK nuclease family protein [bacterium]|nr:PD-(D/E)XK nuclease family protein [bacterium]